MYYRRKILLSLIQQFGGTLNKTDFQKLLFLLSKRQSKSNYDFIPYKFGCFSFQAQQDVLTMMKYNQIEEINGQWVIKDTYNYKKDLQFNDKLALTQLYADFKNLKGDILIKYVYQRFPYYAINSEIAQRLLNEKQLEVIESQKVKKNEYALFTIGYEGLSVETYVNKLINEDIRLLCDVRKNPLSMKYGFSKTQLKKIVEGIGITYAHIPELGIESDKRKELNSPKDYDYLFEEYESTVLRNKYSELQLIYNYLKNNKRIALTCFEADSKYCHRSRVAKAVNELTERKNYVQHI